MPYEHILVDDPRPRVRRITLNRPEKRNALNNRLRAEVFEVLEQAAAMATYRFRSCAAPVPAFPRATIFRRIIESTSPITRPQARANGRATSSKAGSRSGIWRSPWWRRCTATVLPAAPNLRPLRHRLRRRRRPDRLSAGTADESAGHAVSSLAGRHAPRHGTDVDR